MKLRRGIPAKSDPRHREVQLAHGRVRQGEEPRIVLPLRYPQHGVHADIHLMDRGEGVVAGRSDAHAAARDPAVIQLPTVAQAKVDAPEFRGHWLAGVGKDGVGLDEVVSDAAGKAQGIERILPQRMGEGEILPDHLKVGRLSLDGNLGNQMTAVSDGVGGVHAAAKASHPSHAAHSSEPHHVVGQPGIVAVSVGIGALSCGDGRLLGAGGRGRRPEAEAQQAASRGWTAGSWARESEGQGPAAGWTVWEEPG